MTMNHIYERIAAQTGTTPEEIRADIQAAIEAAWNDPDSATFRAQLFPEGKPEPEQFIRVMAGQV